MHVDIFISSVYGNNQSIKVFFINKNNIGIVSKLLNKSSNGSNIDTCGTSNDMFKLYDIILLQIIQRVLYCVKCLTKI